MEEKCRVGLYKIQRHNASMSTSRGGWIQKYKLGAEGILHKSEGVGLRIFAGLPIYHPLSNVISAAVGFVYISLQPKY